MKKSKLKSNVQQTLLSLLISSALLHSSLVSAVDRVCNPFGETSINCPVIDNNIIKASSINSSGHVTGQYISLASPTLNASNNNVTLNGVKTSGASVGLLGGGIQLRTSQGNVSLVSMTLDNNNLTVNNGSVVHSFVYGSMLSANAAINFQSASGAVINMNGNSVNINQGAMVGLGNLPDVSAAYGALQGSVYLDGNFSLNSSDNTTTIDGGTVTHGNVQALRGIIQNVRDADYLTVNANNNQVIVKNDAQVGGAIYGTNGMIGYSAFGNGNGLIGPILTVNFTADNTKVDIANSRIGGDVAGNYGNINSIQANHSLDTDFTNAEVNIDSATIGGKVYGSLFIAGGTEYHNSNATIDSNIITIQDTNNTLAIGGSNGGEVYGGYLDLASVTAIDNSSFQATNNTVNIKGNVNANTFDKIYGGFINDSSSLNNSIIDSFTGNTLHFAASSITLSELGNFENYQFTINDSNKDMINKTDALITVNGNIVNDDIQNSDNTTTVATIKDVSIEHFSYSAIDPNEGLATGSYYTLIKADNMSNALFANSAWNDNAPEAVNWGWTKEVIVKYKLDGNNNLIAYIEGSAIKEDDGLDPLKTLSEGRLAQLMQVTQAGDLLANDVWSRIKKMEHGDFAPFVLVQQSHNRYKSGKDSRVTSDATNLIMGGNYQLHDWTLGAFFEYGTGSYKTDSEYNTGNFSGKGNHHYVGGGLLAKFMRGNGYFDASIHAGKSTLDFNSNDLNSHSGLNASYRIDDLYFGGHMGGGYAYKYNDRNTFETSAKVLYTYLKKDDVKLHDSPFAFKSAKSSRIQLSEKWQHELNSLVSLKAGIIYEYEFVGNAPANLEGYDLGVATVKGATGIGSIGAIITPFANDPNKFIEVTVKGYGGKRTGMAGIIYGKYTF